MKDKIKNHPKLERWPPTLSGSSARKGKYPTDAEALEGVLRRVELLPKTSGNKERLRLTIEWEKKLYFDPWYVPADKQVISAFYKFLTENCINKMIREIGEC